MENAKKANDDLYVADLTFEALRAVEAVRVQKL
jgi:hypothetical protein